MKYHQLSHKARNPNSLHKTCLELETMLTFISGLVNFTWKWIKCDREVQPAKCLHVSSCLVNSPNVVCRLKNALNYIFHSGNYSDVYVNCGSGRWCIVVHQKNVYNAWFYTTTLWIQLTIYANSWSLNMKIHRPCINLWPGSARNAVLCPILYYTNRVDVI